MALTKKVTRVGNSAGMTFDQPVMKQLEWEVGTQVDFKVRGRQLILTPRDATNKEAGASGAKVVQNRRQLIERLAKR